MPWVNVFAGVLLLFFGRRLFWLFVAVSGFLAGMFLARDHFALHSELLVLAIALLCGFIGALLSIFLQKISIALAGFGGGGYLGALLLQELNQSSMAWAGFLVGGIIGAILLFIIFDWALIGLSSFLGAAVVASNLPIEEPFAFPVFVAAVIVGIAVQALQMNRARVPSEARAK